MTRRLGVVALLRQCDEGDLNPQVGRENAEGSGIGVGRCGRLWASGYPKTAPSFPQR